MEKHIVKILAADFVTHNVKRFRVEKPAEYYFIPGQATVLAINSIGLETELRPFTFTCLNTVDYLEFIIKIYKGHDGITEKLENLKIGDELILHEVFGTIGYKGSGVFIAGGAGITPFIAILRQLKEEDKLLGNTLLFGNKTTEDIVLHQELNDLLGEHYLDIISNPSGSISGKRIDRQLLSDYIDLASYYYICGPDQFTSDIVSNLKDLGVPDSLIVIEQ